MCDRILFSRRELVYLMSLLEKTNLKLNSQKMNTEEKKILQKPNKLIKSIIAKLSLWIKE